MDNVKIDYTEVNEVAAVICGLDMDADYAEVENYLCDEFDISIESFEQILQKLYNMIDFVCHQ